MAASTNPAQIIRAILLLALVTGLAELAAASGPTWPEHLYNPKPLPGDVIVPMPCGGAMAFRRVTVPTAGQPRAGFDGLDGPFAAGDGSRYFLIGKYEVSVLQFAAVRAFAEGTDCPAATLADAAKAKGNVSWPAASGFGDDYSGWLRVSGRDRPTCRDQSIPCVPRIGTATAKVRLLGEREWEYAARGGLAVDPQAFAATLYPAMGASVERHAWVTANARGEVQPIGLLAPNPLGLHDLYGNVSEMLRDKRIGETRHGPGEVFVVRGGSRYSTSAELSAVRHQEVSLYDREGQVDTSATGFRVIIGAPQGAVGIQAMAARAARAAAGRLRRSLAGQRQRPGAAVGG